VYLYVFVFNDKKVLSLFVRVSALPRDTATAPPLRLILARSPICIAIAFRYALYSTLADEEPRRGSVSFSVCSLLKLARTDRRYPKFTAAIIRKSYTLMSDLKSDYELSFHGPLPGSRVSSKIKVTSRKKAPIANIANVTLALNSL